MSEQESDPSLHDVACTADHMMDTTIITPSLDVEGAVLIGSDCDDGSVQADVHLVMESVIETVELYAAVQWL